jgi:hypothetical protein
LTALFKNSLKLLKTSLSWLLFERFCVLRTLLAIAADFEKTLKKTRHKSSSHNTGGLKFDGMK